MNRLLFLVLFLNAAFVSPGEILLTEKVNLSPVHSLSGAEMTEDLILLQTTLKNSYGGMGVLQDNQEKKLLEGLASLENQQVSWSSGQFCDEIGKIIESIGDYHLSVYSGDRACKRIWPTASVGKNIGLGLGNQTWNLIHRSFNGIDIDVLSIKKMSFRNSPDWNDFLSTVQSLIHKSDSFIIDVRGNAGGDVTMPMEMSRILYGIESGKTIPYPRKTIYRRTTATAWALLANSFWLQIQDQNSPPIELKNQYEYLVELYKQHQQGELPISEVEEFGETTIPFINPVKNPIYILIDARCGSSCELLLESLEKHPSIITVGERTTGIVQFGNLGKVYLPHSHLVVHIPTQGAIYADERRVEKIGYQPKVSVPPGTEALSFTLESYFQ